MRFRWEDQALDEYETAAQYYSRIEVVLGDRFIESIESGIEDVCDSPKSWPYFDDECRRRIVDVFPYSLIYIEDDGLVVLVAVMHHSREPGYWKSRLR